MTSCQEVSSLEQVWSGASLGLCSGSGPSHAPRAAPASESRGRARWAAWAAVGKGPDGRSTRNPVILRLWFCSEIGVIRKTLASPGP